IDPRIPAGAIYNTLYSPAINDSGQVAYRAKWKAGRVSGYGVFVGGTLVSAVGDEPPGFPGDPIKSLGDPQINSEGEVAFLASMVSKARAVFTDQGGSLALAVQNGAPAPGLAGAELGSVRSFLLTDTALHWQTILKSGPGGVSRANDAVLYRWSPGSGNELALREGQSVGPLGTLKSFKTLKASAPGGAQSRYAGPGDGVLVVASFTDKSKGVISVVPGAVTEIVHSGTAVPGDPAGATFNSFGLPFGANGDWVGGLAKLKSGVGGVTSADATVILAGEPGSDYLNLVARQGDFATDEAGAPLGGVQFKGFKEPVFSPEGDAAFLATLKGTVTKTDDSGIWSRPAESMAPLLLAREGGAVAEADPVETWAKFTALAQPGGSTGPLIGGALTGATVTRANDAGLWGVDSAGDLRLLLREGATVDGKTVKTIHVLKVVAGSLGVTRSFNDHGEVVALVGFANGSSAIVRVVVP
ncbi:MAG: hypothetical protein KDM64_08945, partial [Verrucomicrobiae bacterium]|nr:hypothetical protein [Verrucomicrobiae bacterium]